MVKRGGPTACDKCLPPLFPENYKAVEIYKIVSNQFIMSFGGVVDINITAVIDYMKLIGLENDTDTFHKVIMACRANIQGINDESKAANQREKMKAV